MAMSVAPSSGMAVLRPIAVIASRRGRPSLRSTRMPSTMTMALSTSIPMARMKAASETRCIVPSKSPRMRNEPTTIITRLMPMIMPLRKPIVSMRIATTMSTDSTRFTKKVVSASVTCSGWKKTLWHSMPAGNRSASSSASRRSTSAPTLTISVPEAAATAMPNARCPS